MTQHNGGNTTLNKYAKYKQLARVTSRTTPLSGEHVHSLAGTDGCTSAATWGVAIPGDLMVVLPALTSGG